MIRSAKEFARIFSRLRTTWESKVPSRSRGGAPIDVCTCLLMCPLWRLPISRSIGAYKGVYDGCQICRGIVAAEEIVLPSECQQPNGILDEVVADVDPTVIQKPMQVSCIRLNLFTCIIFHRTRPDLARVFNTFRMGNISPSN